MTTGVTDQMVEAAWVEFHRSHKGLGRETDLHRARRCLEAALRSQGKVEGWRTIESAPKDGREIILGYTDVDDHDLSFVGGGRWFHGDDDGPDNMGHDSGFMDNNFQFFRCPRTFGATDYQDVGLQPTHWMPLPIPPTNDLTAIIGEGD